MTTRIVNVRLQVDAHPLFRDSELLKDLREQLCGLQEDPPRKVNQRAWRVGEVAVAIEGEG
jgi:hypothetical protein